MSTKALSFFSDSAMEEYKQLPFEERLLRIGDVNAAGQIMLTATMLLKHEKITKEQHDALFTQATALVEAIHLPHDKYQIVFKETGTVINSILGDSEEISAEARAKMN